MKSNISAGVSGVERFGVLGRLSARLARTAGRKNGLRDRSREMIETLESRVMLDGADHPNFPVPFNPSVGTVITLTNMPGAKENGRGKVEGNIATSSGDDTFRFTMPGAMGSKDFVSVLVDTILKADDATVWNSTFDSYVEVYNSSGTLISFGANNGVLSSTNPNVAPDAWTGFVGTAGETYTIRVRAEQGALGAGRTRTGNYTLRVDAATEAIAIDTVFDPAPGKGADTFGEGSVADLTSFRQDEVVYKLVVPDDSRFNGLATASAISEDVNILDTHLSVYDAQGLQVTDDQQAGRLTNAFSTFVAQQNTTYYFRVRSDELGAGRPAFGQYTLVVDMSALPLPLDQVTRVNTTRQDPLLGPTMNTPGTASKMYQFRAEGTGLAFVTVRGAASGLIPALQDVAVRILDSNGVQIDFNDDFAGTNDAQLEVVLTGGSTYYVLVEGFDRGADGAFTINIEAHHTFGPTVPVDDHEDGPQAGGGGLLAFENATPIIFGDPFRFTNSDGNVIDANWKQRGVARGRSYAGGDSDLFQFVPPLNQQGRFEGDDGDQGSALYLGGNFANATYAGSTSGAHAIDADNTVIWDAERYYNAGPAHEVDGALDGTINTMISWDPDDSGPGAPILVAGGLFNMLDDMGNSVPVNLALRVFVPFNPLDPASPRWQWTPLGADGEVFALAVGELIDQGVTGQELIVGGSFGNVGGLGGLGNLIAISGDGNGGLLGDALGGGVSGGGNVVKALAFYEPPAAPDPDGAGMQMAPPDEPLGLYVGGSFTTAGTGGGAVNNVNNIARFGVIDPSVMPAALAWEGLGTTGYSGGALGIAGIDEVLAIQAYQPPAAGGGMQPAPRLYVGGRTGGTNGFLNFWDPTATAGNAWTVSASGGTGPVFAMDVWTPPTSINPQMNQFLVIGGGTNAAGYLRVSLGGATNSFLPAVDGAIRDIVVRVDDEPGFASDTQQLFIGGTFTTVTNFNGDMLQANGVARFDGDFPQIGGGDWNTLGGGVTNLSPGAAAPVGVFALADFNDNIPGVWDRMERASSRVSIRVNPTADAFFQAVVTVYDSNLNVVYTNQTLSTQVDTPNAGAFDPTAPDDAFINISPPTELGAAPSFNVWGGEVYYIEVTGAGTGRYTVEVITDAVPPEAMDNGDGAYQNEIGAYFEQPDGTTPDPMALSTPILLDPNRAVRANEITIDADGHAHSFRNPTDPNNPSAYTTQTFDLSPGGFDRLELSDLPVIDRVGDTDLYKFRAPATGYAEIRIATFGINMGWQEIITDNVNQTSDRLSRAKTINSPLDSALRIFNNDFEQIGYNNDNLASAGFLSNYFVDGQADGPMGPDQIDFDPDNRTFRHRDARLIIPVTAGQSYFIQVESGQLLTFLNPDAAVSTLVDWRHAIGAYDLVLGMTPSLNGIDDHSNGSASATPVLITDATGDGQVNGIIDDVITGVFQNPDDRDVFSYIAPNRGQTIFRVIPQGANNQLRTNIQIFDAANGAIVAQTAVGPGQTAQLVTFPEQGDQYYIVINGDAGSEGAYRLTVDGQGIIDDHASERNWAGATPLLLVPFFGTATANGVIENPDDQDVFKYTAETYETASVKVDSLDVTLDPFVQVYEVSSDLDDSTMGNPVLLQISFNNDGPNDGVDSVATFSTTPGRTYYIVVSGLDLNVDRGRYQVQVKVSPTDDHPNFSDFPLGTTLALTFDSLTQMGMNTPVNGNIEKNIDNDMFRFTAPANGLATVTIATPDSLFAPAVRIFDQTGVEIVALTDGTNGSVMVTIPSITLNQQYYIQVLPGTTGVNETDDTGTYTVKVVTEPVDDHPDDGEFAMIVSPRDVITLSSVNGVGTKTGILVPDGDTDLFRFTTLAGGSTLIRVTTTGSSLSPRIRIFNAAFSVIATGTGDGDTAQQTITAGAAGETYYVLVEKAPGATGAQAVGNYQLSVSGQIPGGGGGGGGGGPDDHANAGEFNSATVITLNSRTGYGQGTGIINFIGDTDLFKFTALNSGPVQVQITVPAGGLVDGQVKIYNQSQVLIASNAAGLPGSTAALSFNATLGQMYFVLVEPVGSSTGSYDVRLDTQPLNYFLYYPEGFASKRIDEFVPIVNPNSFTVTYSLYARYETGANPDVPIWTGSVAPNSRSGVTVTTRKNFAGALVRPNTPYSLELRADGPLSATFSHYDFNVSVGESFTRDTSTTWTFANFTKDPAEFRDFLVFYNPAATTANVTITLYYENGFTTSFSQSIESNRRSGVNINNDGRVPQNGRFGVKVESDQPIVAAQSSYNLLNGGGDGTLGDSDGGSIEGVTSSVSTGGGVSGRLAILNSGTEAATVTVTASYSRVDIPDLTRVIVVQPGRTFSQSLAQFGLTNGEVAGLRYTSNNPVTMNVIQYQNGDGDGTVTATRAATKWQFGDAFMNPRRAGITYIEDLTFFNPGNSTLDITVTFIFRNSAPSQSTTISVSAGDFAFVSVDQQPIILGLTNSQPFSISVSGATPFVAFFTHYDRFLNGGWTALGSPVGLENDLSSI